jgi:hypothetical protein
VKIISACKKTGRSETVFRAVLAKRASGRALRLLLRVPRTEGGAVKAAAIAEPKVALTAAASVLMYSEEGEALGTDIRVLVWLLL